VHSSVQRAAAGGGPTLIEALTYRVEAHTNADDAGRYREAEEVQAWIARDPITRLEAYLKAEGLLTEVAAKQLAAEAEQLADGVRDRMNHDVDIDPAQLFAHVYVRPTAALAQQRAALLSEIAEDAQ
jgi:2-oxoisovalerate dehydrogenase E1 component alpha subunit